MGIALERIKKSVSMQSQRKSVELPDGSEFEFWMTPLTLTQRARAQKQAKSEDATDFALQLLAMKATDENGQKMFDAGDIVEMRNEIPASVAEAMMLQLLADGEQEEAEEETDLKSTGKAAKG